VVKILNLEALKAISEESSIENINKTFKNILVGLSEYLLLDAINSQVKIVFNINEKLNDQQETNVLDIGVNRSFENDVLIIEILNQYKRFLPIILLREAYYCFVPNDLKENDTLKIVINQIIEIDLHKAGNIVNEWKSIVRGKIVNYDFLSAQFDKLDKFLKLQGSEISERPMAIFFEYIRKNVQIIDDNKDEFYDDLFKEFVFKSSKSLRNDEIIETIRVLIKIFYKVKSYRALLDYQNYFKDMKAGGEIQTSLSLRKFTSNMKWINKYSYIGPSYQVNWNALNVAVLVCKLRFNPLITKDQVDQIVEKLPFFVYSKSSESNFSIEVAGTFIIPHVYLKDLKSFLQKLDQTGYVVKKTCILLKNFENILNLNYFREFYKNKRIINPHQVKYDDGYEIHFKFDYGGEFIDKKCSILDFLILERLRYWSITGFSFERRTETLKNIKGDLINEIISQRSVITTLRENLEIIYDNKDLQVFLLKFLENNKNRGFFFIIEALTNILSCLKMINSILNENPNLKTAYNLIEYINNYGISKNLNDNIIFSKQEIRKIIFQEFIPLIFQKRQRFNETIQEFQTLTNFFKSCKDLKIFNLDSISNIIQEKSLVEKIYDVKERKLKKSYERYKNKKISSNTIDDLIDDYIIHDPSLIKPQLITTINTSSFASYYLHFIVKNSKKAIETIDILKKYFPRIVISIGKEFFTNEELMQIEIYIPIIVNREKSLLISILFNLFKEDLISGRRIFFDGFLEAYSMKDFYDFENSKFFYTKDLFIQLYNYWEQIIGKKLPSFQEPINNNMEKILSQEKDLDKLVKLVEGRISREQINFNIENIKKLTSFHTNLKNSLLDNEKFKQIKQEAFFKRYIHSIKFKPALNRFNLGSYYLYIRPIDLKKADMKLLLANNFLKVKHPAFVDDAPSYFIKYVFPQENPNKAHLNYIVKSIKAISEYCLFKIVRIHQILHFDRYLDSNGWNLSERKFKAHAQKILFNPNKSDDKVGIKEFDLGSVNVSNFYSKNTKEYNDLIKFYNYKSIDLKSILGTNKQVKINPIINLLKKDLIFPLLKLKNLDLKERIYLILPNIKKELIPLILRIFNYFPVALCYEIRGEYYNYGLEEINFESGLFIKLYLPNIDISGLQKIFNLIFNHLGVKKRLFLTDLVDSSQFIESLFGSLEFMKSYNPLNNLIWNKIDNKWTNVKLYGENFVKKYPNLY